VLGNGTDGVEETAGVEELEGIDGVEELEVAGAGVGARRCGFKHPLRSATGDMFLLLPEADDELTLEDTEDAVDEDEFFGGTYTKNILPGPSSTLLAAIIFPFL
jgi:hypothetical protein